MDELLVLENLEVVVFVIYWSIFKYSVKVFVLGEMVDVSEKLRQNGLFYIYFYFVCILQIRFCFLELFLLLEKIFVWKLIRSKKKKFVFFDELVCKQEKIKIRCMFFIWIYMYVIFKCDFVFKVFVFVNSVFLFLMQ